MNPLIDRNKGPKPRAKNKFGVFSLFALMTLRCILEVMH